MMTKLREFSKLFIYVVALSFILLMVFEWGADYSGQSRVDDMIGSVNDEEIKYAEFERMVQQVYQQDKAQSGRTNYSEEELQRLRSTVWEQFIQGVLLAEQMENFDITVSDSEIVYQIYNYPLDDFKRHPSFQTDGVFDINKYHAAFTNPEIPWMRIEAMYREKIPLVKLQNIITNTVRVADSEVMDSYRKQNLKAKVEYLALDNMSFNQNVQVSADEVESYYSVHKDEYKQAEQRQLSYLVFPITITAKDTQRVLNDFETIKSRLEKGEDFGRLALEFSHDPNVNANRGDLGYIEEGSMPGFSEAAFSAKPGEIVGPISFNSGYHLIKVDDRKNEDGKDKVKASHILINVTPAPSTESAQEQSAREMREILMEGEQKFITLAEENDLELKETGLFEEGSGFVPTIGIDPSIAKFTFVGELKEAAIYRVNDGYGVFQITQINEEGVKDLESVRSFIENRVKLEKAKEKARNYAQTLSEKVQTGMPFQEIADTDTSRKVNYDVSPLFGINDLVPRVGTFIEFNATAFSLEHGENSDLVETDRGFYYMKLLEKTEFDSAAYNSGYESTKRQLLGQKRTVFFQSWYEDLKANAEIIDNRKRFRL